jgi:hypothetical protein
MRGACRSKWTGWRCWSGEAAELQDLGERDLRGGGLEGEPAAAAAATAATGLRQQHRSQNLPAAGHHRVRCGSRRRYHHNRRRKRHKRPPSGGLRGPGVATRPATWTPRRRPLQKAPCRPDHNRDHNRRSCAGGRPARCAGGTRRRLSRRGGDLASSVPWRLPSPRVRSGARCGRPRALRQRGQAGRQVEGPWRRRWRRCGQCRGRSETSIRKHALTLTPPRTQETG